MNTSHNPIVRLWKWWFTPRSSDPTVAYRERALRVLLPLFSVLRVLVAIQNHSGLSDLLKPYASLWVHLVFVIIPLFFSFYFLAQQKIGWAGACFLLHWYLIDMLNLPAEGYWYPGIQISLILQVVMGTLLLPSRTILPYMFFQLLTVGLWGNWLDVNYYEPPLFFSGEPVAFFQRTILTLAVQESIIVFVVRYLRMEMEKSLRLQQVTIEQLQIEIADCQQAELSLQQLENIYRRAIDATGAVPYIFDPAARTLRFLGDGILSMTGYPASELMSYDQWNKVEQEGFPRGKLAHLTYEEADRITNEDPSIP
jgi:hypothetical protein